MNIKVLCFDFDGVINLYAGWQNEGFDVILGTPIPGAKETIQKLRNKGYLVLTHSTRCSYPGGAVAVTEYLNKHNIRVDGVCSNKPPADIYIDDKGLTFNGDWSTMIEAIETFKPWDEICADSNKKLPPGQTES